MFRFILCLFLLVPFSSSASDWTREDSYREATYLTLHTVDWAQTRNIARNYKSCVRSASPYYCGEYNPILGKSPSVSDVDKYFIATAALQFTVAYYLPAEYRKAFQYISIGHDAGYVVHNFSIGIGAKF